MPENAAQPDPVDRLNVLLLIGDLGYGGAERQVVLLAAGLSREGMNVHIATFSPLVPLADSMLDQSRLHILPGRSPLATARLIRKLHTRIVHAFLLDAEIVACLAARLLHGVIVVGSERSTRHAYAPWQRFLWRITTGNLRLCIANTAEGARWHSTSFGRPRRHYRVIHNGVDTRRFRPADAADLRERLGLAPETFVIGLFASFKSVKNHVLLLRACRVLRNRGVDLRVLLVGAGVVRGRSIAVDVEHLIGELGLDDCVVMLGHVADPEHFYPACDLTVLPSRHEGTPNVVLESMACAVPVLVSDVPGNREIADQCSAVRTFVAGGPADGVDALVSALSRLLSQRDRLPELGRLCRQQVEAHYGVDRLCRETAQAYREVVHPG